MTPPLAPAQAAAICHVREDAEPSRSRAAAAIDRLLEQHGVARAAFDEVTGLVATQGQIELNFHPDRRIVTGESVAEAMLREGVCRSQFETGISAGSRTAFPGGFRDRWEHRLFGGAHRQPGVTNDERPKYGALNLMNYSDGAAPWLGSCYVCLRPEVSQRATFSCGDSVTEPEIVGTMAVFEPIWSAILDEVASRGSALGSGGLTVAELLNRISKSVAGGRRASRSSRALVRLGHV